MKIFGFRKILITVVAVCVIGMFCCLAKRNGAVAAKPESADIAPRKYLSPTPGEICIVASTVYPDESEPTYVDFKQAADCGFNVVIQNSTTAIFEKSLPLIDSVGMKLLMSSGELSAYSEERCLQYIEKFKNYPALGGWVVKDEPSYAQLKQYSKRYDYISRIDPDHMAYMNLVGVTSEYFGGPRFSTLQAYLEEVRSECNPSPWSYDFYPISEKKGNTVVNYNGFYKALRAYSDMSKKSGVPFWAYCMSSGHRINNNISPTPTEAYLRFEAFSALGYGAQGVVYWTYYQRSNVPSANLYYDSALVDHNRKKTKIWYYARNVNMEIKALSDVFLGCRLIDCVHTGKNHYEGTEMCNGKFGPLDRIISGDAGVQLSWLENGGKNYLVVVNHDVKNVQQLSLTFARNVKVESIAATQRNSLKSRQNTVMLNAGGYAIFCWQD